ncbi:MAG: MATE family efflux transporter [Terrisporobacter othiniensis]|uniref:MATE family efflux transporter n=1 Tax=Terrisporobacter othiniensis TaxID=1577792 RepID=UPI000942870E|nr:MATE family efflux transporter [Terrisporobacter othiniensis]MDY3373146.1 MATE family efflux transporter [Terrisporobacter othiniensis]
MAYLVKNKNNIITITTLAIPVIIENILQTLLGTVDTYFAGQISDKAIAAIGVTNLIMNVFIVFFTAISVGTSAVVARNFGREEMNKVKEATTQSIFLGIIISLIVGIINILFYEPILKICGARHEILNLATPYYLVVVVPIIFLCLSLILSSCLRATKDTKTPMIATAFANILNIILNILFINMNMGIVGLALATTISRCMNVVILLIKLKINNINIKLNKEVLKDGRETLKSIIKIGAPAGMEKLIMRLGQLVYNSMIISIGVSAYVAHNIAGNIESYTYIPALGFGVATATLVGITLGEGDSEKSKEIVYLADVITTICMVVIGILLFIFAPQIVTIFTNTKEVQIMVVNVLRLIALFQCFIAITQIFTSALQGAGDTKFPMYATLIGIWGVRVGIGYFLGVIMNMGLFGVWIAYALDITVRAFLLMIRFNHGKWKSITI